MNPLICVNFCRKEELDCVAGFSSIFGSSFRGLSSMPTGFTSWPVDSMRKDNIEWTKRMLRLFLNETGFDCLVKIDPDTTINGPLPLSEFDVAGDFRLSKSGWAWFGGYHFFSREAALKILNDPFFSGQSHSQDLPLTQSVIRLKLSAENLSQVNCWRMPDDGDCVVSHMGHCPIQRPPPGPVNFT